MIALGLEQFVPFVSDSNKKFKHKKYVLMDAIDLIVKYLVPVKTAKGIKSHVDRHRYQSKDSNDPIKVVQNNTLHIF